MHQYLYAERLQQLNQTSSDVTAADQPYRATSEVSHHLELRRSLPLLTSAPRLI